VLAMWREDAGFVEAVVRGARAEIYGRLRKRYVTPMVPEPEQVVQWIADLATPRLYGRRGVTPGDPTIAGFVTIREDARTAMKEAADAKDGLYDLPLLDAGDATAISKGGPLASAEASPYDWVDRQIEALYGR